MKVKAAFYSRVSNKALLEEASTILYGEAQKLRPFSAAILGHVIRAKGNDQMMIIAIDAQYKRVERAKRRVGRPRFFWLQTTMSRATKLRRKFQRDVPVEFDIRIKAHQEYVASAALQREYPFHQKTKKRKPPSKKGRRTKQKHNNGENARQKRTRQQRTRKDGKTKPERIDGQNQASGETQGGHKGSERQVEEPTEEEARASPWKFLAVITTAVLRRVLNLQRTMKKKR